MNPIIENLHNGKKTILFLGSMHSSGYDKLESIKKSISDFKPELILVEDDFDKAEYINEQEAIEKGKDMGYVSFLAKKHKINIISNDPSFEENVSFLEKRYGRDFSFLYFFLRDKSSSTRAEGFENSINDKKILEHIINKVNWQNYDYSVGHIKKIFKDIFKKELREVDYSDFFNPTLNINEFSQATRELNVFRDEYMLRKIEENIKKCNKIFIIKGKHHLITMKSKIKKLLEYES